MKKREISRAIRNYEKRYNALVSGGLADEAERAFFKALCDLFNFVQSDYSDNELKEIFGVYYSVIRDEYLVKNLGVGVEMKSSKYYVTVRRKLLNRIGTEDRSAWDKGVTVYALEMLDNVVESIDYSGKEPETLEELKNLVLNGAESWTDYSWGGSALICDSDIAERLCTPSELKKKKGGERRPNSREHWLDVQARALYQAFLRLAIVWEIEKN